MGQSRQIISAITQAVTRAKIAFNLTAISKLRTERHKGNVKRNILLDQQASAERYALLASGCGEERHLFGIGPHPLIG
jgi:hypothetical protein